MSDERLKAPALDRLRVLVDRHVQENYRALRVERGWSWEQLAEDLERQAVPLPPEHAFPYELLGQWARAEGKAAPERDPATREGTTPEPAQPPGPDRTTERRRPPRRAA